MGVARYIAVLAYPEESEWGERDNFLEHLKGYLVKKGWRRGLRHGQSAREGGWSSKYTGMRWRNIELVMERAFKRVQQRFWCGQLALSIRLQSITAMGVSFTFPEIEEMADFFAPFWRAYSSRPSSDTETGMDEADFRKRIWIPTQRVLHLAAVYPRTANGSSGEDPVELVKHPEWLEAALDNSELLLLWIAKRFPSFDAENVIHLIPLR
jgi:hypothetical protein